MAVRAVAKNISVSPKKIRRALDAVRGQKVESALQTLAFMPTPAARHVAKAVKSAANNAENNNYMSQEDLRIVAIHADPGATLKRFRARSRGRASRIAKRTTHVTVWVEEEVA